MKLNPPNLYKFSIIFMIALALLPFGKVIHYPFNLLGMIPFLGGAYMAVSAKRVFLNSDTPLDPDAQPICLLTTGLYSFSRNPMYLGITIGLLGVAVITGQILNFVFPVIYFILMDLIFIKKEEKNLKDTFGEEYKLYTKEVNRWI